MQIPRPLSEDWLYWNPETIHRYPDSISSETPAESEGSQAVVSLSADDRIDAADATPSPLIGLRKLLILLAGLVAGLGWLGVVALLIGSWSVSFHV